MKRILWFILTAVAILVFAAAQKPSGPVIVASQIVVVPAGTSFGPSVLYTPTANGIYEVALFGSPCPGIGGSAVFVRDPSGANHQLDGGITGWVAAANQSITWTGGADPSADCTLYVTILQL